MGFLDPESVVYMLSLKPGQKVVDFGCGSGRYSIPMAKAVSPNGKVYAIDIQDMLVHTTENESRREGIQEDVVVGVVADLEKEGSTNIKDQSIDLVLISNTLFLVDKKENLVKEASRILKNNARLVVIDWVDSFSGLGPPSDMLVLQEEVVDMAEKYGLSFYREYPPSAHHYILEFRK